VKSVILAGGFGSRLAEETDLRPKPMVEIGGDPILLHIMRRYAAFGHREFVLALGYLGHVVKDYFIHQHHRHNDLVIDLGSGEIDVQSRSGPDWTVHLIDTGLATMTGGRLARLRDEVGDDTFMMTYGDSVADVDITALIGFHERHGKAATLTIVRPPARFGRVTVDGDLVASFEEKPQLGEGWINGGFFVLEPVVFDYLGGDDCVWEGEPLERLAADGELMAFRHPGYWQAMDTLRDKRQLEEVWSAGSAPWEAA